jgi:glycosyltransferase involved in cell wall biosynthesis
MSVLYLTSVENVILSGVAHSQVFELVRFLHARHAIPIHVLSFVPVHNRLRFRSGLRALRGSLSGEGITLTVHPILLRSRVYLTPAALHFLRAQCLDRLRKSARELGARLVHARGYPSAHLAAEAGLPFVFDGRGLYRLEALSTASWSDGSAPARFWESEEERLVARCERFVGVSPYFASAFPNGKTVVIPCFATPPDTDRQLPEPVRRFLSDGRVLVYSGSLTSWYTPAPLFQEFERLVRATRWRVLVLTSDLEVAEMRRRKAGLTSDQLMIVRLAPGQVPLALSLASAAVWAAFGGDDRLHASQLGVKFAEYAAAGLPIVVTRNLRQPATFVERFEAGVVLDPDAREGLGAALERSERDFDRMGRNARRMFEEHFTLEAAGRAYARLYEEILSARAARS